GDVEMLMIFSDVEALDHRGADRAKLLHDDRVPLLPAPREPGPRRSLAVSDLIGARHRPSPYRCTHPTRRHPLAGGHTARSGTLSPARLRHILTTDRLTPAPVTRPRTSS